MTSPESPARLVTKDELKAAIRTHLVQAAEASDTQDLRPFTKDVLLQYVSDGQKDLVGTALQELEQEGVLSSETIAEQIYLPHTSAGKRIRSGLARSRLVSTGIVIPALLGTALTALFLYGVWFDNMVLDAASAEGPVEPREAFAEGQSDAFWGTLVVLSMAVGLSHFSIHRYRLWRKHSEEQSKIALKFATGITAIVVLGAGAFWVTHRLLDQAALSAVVGIATSLVTAFAAIWPAYRETRGERTGRRSQ